MLLIHVFDTLARFRVKLKYTEWYGRGHMLRHNNGKCASQKWLCHVGMVVYERRPRRSPTRLGAAAAFISGAVHRAHRVCWSFARVAEGPQCLRCGPLRD